MRISKNNNSFCKAEVVVMPETSKNFRYNADEVELRRMSDFRLLVMSTFESFDKDLLIDFRDFADMQAGKTYSPGVGGPGTRVYARMTVPEGLSMNPQGTVTVLEYDYDSGHLKVAFDLLFSLPHNTYHYKGEAFANGYVNGARGEDWLAEERLTKGHFKAEIKSPDGGIRSFDLKEAFIDFRPVPSNMLIVQPYDDYEGDLRIAITFLDYKEIKAGQTLKFYPDSEAVDGQFVSLEEGRRVQWTTLPGGTLQVHAIDNTAGNGKIEFSFNFSAWDEQGDGGKARLVGSANLTGYSNNGRVVKVARYLSPGLASKVK
ncbi:hypothetical protein ACQKP7_24090 [Pseudomonas frederiksbergensis]|uniref:hypothetical protein n=1 Tax=Pseudomonas frederiksbergensis TaxID=104087 RepID=UPI003CFC43BA